VRCLVVMQVVGVPTEAASLAGVPMAVASLVVVASVAVVVASRVAGARASGRVRRFQRPLDEPARIEP
jgi:hypothetical protein